MDSIKLDEANKLSISELNRLVEFAEGMIHNYTESKEYNDIKRWQDKLEAVNKIIASKVKFVNN